MPVDVYIDSNSRDPAGLAWPQVGAGATAAAARLEVTMKDVTQELSGESFIRIASSVLTAARRVFGWCLISAHSSPLESSIHRWQPADRAVKDDT